MRKPFQGVLNILRFNWHFYVFALVLLLFVFLIIDYFSETFQLYFLVFSLVIILTTFISLSVSYYVYDLSDLYTLNWAGEMKHEGTILNINAGFDETSALLQAKFNQSKIIAFDFYDPLKHTEISIKRARKAYPQFPGTKEVRTTDLQIADNSADNIFVILSAHEIRNENERFEFFRELKKVVKPTGKIFITEHLRDIPNFLAYNIGFFHFHSRATWFKTFKEAQLKIQNEIKITPFISTFILEKDADSF